MVKVTHLKTGIREEEIKKASDELFKSFRCSKTYRIGFEAGVMWSDEHLQVPKIISKSMTITREQAKELLPIVKALAEGKMIQDKIEGLTDWVDTDEINLEYNGQKIKHRIKPESKYRPFNSVQEVLDEMHKHPDFGFIREKSTKVIYGIAMIDNFYLSTQDTSEHLSDTLGIYEFLDGSPFGIKEEC